MYGTPWIQGTHRAVGTGDTWLAHAPQTMNYKPMGHLPQYHSIEEVGYVQLTPYRPQEKLKETICSKYVYRVVLNAPYKFLLAYEYTCIMISAGRIRMCVIG